MKCKVQEPSVALAEGSATAAPARAVRIDESTRCTPVPAAGVSAEVPTCKVELEGGVVGVAREAAPATAEPLDLRLEQRENRRIENVAPWNSRKTVVTAGISSALGNNETERNKL